jgi:hypothetical protein
MKRVLRKHCRSWTRCLIGRLAPPSRSGGHLKLRHSQRQATRDCRGLRRSMVPPRPIPRLTKRRCSDLDAHCLRSDGVTPSMPLGVEELGQRAEVCTACATRTGRWSPCERFSYPTCRRGRSPDSIVVRRSSLWPRSLSVMNNSYVAVVAVGISGYLDASSTASGSTSHLRLPQARRTAGSSTSRQS